jgi:hypothetical protein
MAAALTRSNLQPARERNPNSNVRFTLASAARAFSTQMDSSGESEGRPEML